MSYVGGRSVGKGGKIKSKVGEGEKSTCTTQLLTDKIVFFLRFSGPQFLLLGNAVRIRSLPIRKSYCSSHDDVLEFVSSSVHTVEIREEI